MEIDVFTNLISTIGFPIAACIALFYMCKQFIEQMQKTNDDNRASINEISKSISEMNLTLSKLDSTLDKIYTKLDNLDDRVNDLEKAKHAAG